MIEANNVRHVAQVSGFKKIIQGLAGGSGVKKLGFLTFSHKRHHKFVLIFYMTIEANTLHLLAQVWVFKKSNPGISRGLSVKEFF